MGRAAPLILALALVSASCLQRAQAIVIVDADMPIADDVAADPTLSPASSFDRVEVEVLSADGTAETGAGDGKQLFVVGFASVWPITFGVREGYARLRIRAYRAAHANRGLTGLVEPSPHVVVDRLVFADVSSSGRTTLRIVLHGECLGAPADVRAGTTCVDDPRALLPATSAIEELAEDAPIPARPALWARAHETPCEGTPPRDALCVPGGTFVRGDAATADLDSTTGYLPTPLVPATLRPFYMDRTEVTVGRFRALLEKGALAGVALPEKSATCTWLDAAGAGENRPLTCVTAETARAACKADGGDLPSEAQWEYAARGHGRAAAYPWGDAQPSCCAARIGEPLGCFRARAGASPVGSYADATRCDGIADATPDGILDLAGNVRERVLDTSPSYDDPACAPPGIATDPVCNLAGSTTTAARGGSFHSSFHDAHGSVRTRSDLHGDDLGFRCVYPGAAK